MDIASPAMSRMVRDFTSRDKIDIVKAGEHRLPACSFRQPAEMSFHEREMLCPQKCCRQAAGNHRLAACAPQGRTRTRDSKIDMYTHALNLKDLLSSRLDVRR
jgi:hypothetical protein